jgi:hypothetical protein
MNTDLAERVHEPVILASGPGPLVPSRNDRVSLNKSNAASFAQELFGGGLIKEGIGASPNHLSHSV